MAAWISSCLGQPLGSRHRITRHLASGGMAHVFVVEDTMLGSYAVAKIARPEHPLTATCLALEADMLGRVDHPNIVKLLDYVCTSSNGSYLLLEYVDGVELSAWLESAGALPVAHGLALLSQLAAALDHLHALGIVHSDVKPANVLFDATKPDVPNVKLIDFGVAFLDSTHGEQREFTGTVAYMAPEQCRGHACGTAVDVYGLAALAFEVLTGHLICEYPTRDAALRAALDSSSALAQSFWLERLRAVLRTGLDDTPTARFQTAAELVSELERALREPFQSCASR
jgi:serine/threonine protein kinase